MNAIRISESNQINIRLRDVESFIKFNSDAARRLRSSTMNVDFNRKKIASLTKQNEDFSNEIKLLTERMCQLNRGELDKDLRSKLKEDTKIARKKTLEKRQKKLAELMDKKARSVISKQYWDRTLKAGRQERYSDRSSKRGYDYLIRVEKSLPQYIRANLENMPNNKGYIWRGVHYYGKKNPDKNANRIMFENKKGELYIHEWTPNNLSHTLTIKRGKKRRGEIEFVETFEKNGAGKRILISKVKPPRRTSPRRTEVRIPERKLTPAEARRRSRGNGRTRPNPRPTSGRGRGQGRGRGRGQGQGRGRDRGRGQGRGRDRGRGRGRGRGRVQGRGRDKGRGDRRRKRPNTKRCVKKREVNNK